MAEAASKILKLELVRSPIGGTERQRATVIALGLRKMHQVVEQTDSPVTRGMVKKVAHLVRVVEE
ncbi:MAG TPA: 50S ribosomal protein L30 [Chloroflexota bacterium]|nr:50S ribosomal protein L30 [Chloroflexota bacterium]